MITTPIRLDGSHLNEVLAFESEVFAPSDQWSEAIWVEELQNPQRLYLGLIQDEELIAMAGASLFEVSDLLSIGVRREYEGHGLAGLLLDQLVQVLARTSVASEQTDGIQKPAKQVKKMMLEVRASNERAIGLYASRGFKSIALIPRYYHNPSESAVVMERYFQLERAL